MREWCGCGAAIRAHRSDVLDWRTTHRHEPESPAPLMPPQGAESRVEMNHEQTWLGGESVRIGFRPIQ